MWNVTGRGDSGGRIHEDFLRGHRQQRMHQNQLLTQVTLYLCVPYHSTPAWGPVG